MNTMKTLMLAGFAALSLGTATAMAQESGGPSMIPANDYWTVQQRALIGQQAPTPAPVQAGSSDVETHGLGLNSGWSGDRAPYRYDYGTMANPG
jgi:hypothetical protein